MGGARRSRGWHFVLLAALSLPLGASAAEHVCDTSSAQRRVLRFQGSIVANEARRFAEAFDRCFPSSYRGQVVVDLFSGGGLVDQALLIANALIGHGEAGRPVLTRISRGSYCISACTYLYVAGRFREAEPGASFEPHGFSSYRSARIDLVMQAARSKGLQVAEGHLGDSRLGLIGRVLRPLGEADERFAWLAPMVREYTRDDGMIRRDAFERLIADYEALTPDKKDLLKTLDSIVIVVMTELQREAALQAFGPLLQQGSKAELLTALSAPDEQRYASWMSAEFLGALNRHVAATRAGARLAHLEVAAAALQEQLRKEAGRTMNIVNEDLWPYLARRDNVLDVAGFVKLMFSTTIIYTRPLTHEEMCDLNIVNRGCD